MAVAVIMCCKRAANRKRAVIEEAADFGVPVSLQGAGHQCSSAITKEPHSLTHDASSSVQTRLSFDRN